MKIQNMAVIFIIIILPISMILNAYTGNQIKTLSLQTSYDTKLNNATYDALKAFQLNTINNDTSDLSNSKLRDIEASANTFFNSISSNFNMAGYNQDILKNYVPALVYTMYDGYYIYSPYTNKLDDTNSNEGVDKNEQLGSDAEILNSNNTDATYKEGDKISGIKPYIYYSCKYEQSNGNNFVITYALDNYITIQGEINGEWVYDAGYLSDNIEVSGDNVKYRGINIDNKDKTKEYIDDTQKEYEYIKINGIKYYKDDDGTWFSILNGQRKPQGQFEPDTTAAILYYKEAAEFKKRIIEEYKISDLKASDSVDFEQKENYKIFDFGSMNDTEGSIEDTDSNFNQQRLAVIRYSIERNLSIAIANYNNYSGVTTNFQMPKLQENEWNKIINNVSIISFLQGLNIGGKVYNGYSIITNNKNKEVVSEDSIYMISDEQYHRANDNELVGNNNISIGVLNIDFERKSTVVNGETRYFMPKTEIGCYSSIVSQNDVNATDNFYKYMQEKGGKLAELYYTALARERYGLYKTYNDYETLQDKFGIQKIAEEEIEIPGEDSGNTGGDTGNTGGDSGNTGGDSGNTGGDSGNTGGDSGNTGGDSGNTGGDTDYPGGDIENPYEEEDKQYVDIITNYDKGDVNGDGKINVQDYYLLYRYVLRWTKLNSDQLYRADINCNNVVDYRDLWILGYYLYVMNRNY